ncbi:unnamed protein product [Didymodactylos carnosus]|uniref:Uncharacterized protein n=1 Tax=Didymodactylos carnosus TaxID=1234261 RepID=A0A816C9C3_9BILA|nr:unnamed protein product [Didymodactylos carnosus]CAF4510292.1 unnamed protein product [Didymodactylos carnosus]
MLDIEKLVYNLSDKELTHPQLKLLGRGWKFCIEQKMNETLNVKTEIEYGMQIIKQKIPEGNPSWIKICDQIKIIANDMLKRTEKKSIGNLSNEELQALRELKLDKTIVILKADKGNAVVIMNKKDYVEKVNEMLKVSKKFIVGNVDETMEEEQKINRRLTQLKRNKKITAKEYEIICIRKLNTNDVLHSKSSQTKLSS